VKKVLSFKASKGFRTSLRIPEAALNKINESMAIHGYGSKSRSKWICHAVQSFVAMNDYPALVAQEFMDQGNNVMIPVTVDNVTGLLLEEAEAELKSKNVNTLDADRSAILRSAITHRLIDDGGGLVSL